MPRPVATLHLPQPCAESWAAMTPTGPGRHCAACQRVVVDFTQQTDGEILAYFQQFGGTCGHFRHSQLNRPLQPAAALASPRPRWPAWLALVLATCHLPPARATPLPVPPAAQSAPHHRAQPKRRLSTLAVKYVRGTVRDAATHEALAGVAVFLRGENRMALTDSAGHFQLQLPARRPRGGRALRLHFAGYESQTVRLPATTRPYAALALRLRPDPAAAGVQVVGYRTEQRTDVTGGAAVLLLDAGATSQPAPARPNHNFWHWLTHLLKR